MRFIDELRTGLPMSLGAACLPPIEWMAFQAQFRAGLDNLPIVVADNVDRFITDRFRRDQPGFIEHEVKLADAFPNAVPPFPRFWIEWVPSAALVRRHIERFGVLVSGDRLSDGWRINLLTLARGATQKLAFVSSRSAVVEADPRGVCHTMQTKLLELDLIESREDSFLWRDGLFVPLMTMCFMHCPQHPGGLAFHSTKVRTSFSEAPREATGPPYRYG